jgi:hypothetical protein
MGKFCFTTIVFVRFAFAPINFEKLLLQLLVLAIHQFCPHRKDYFTPCSSLWVMKYGPIRHGLYQKSNFVSWGRSDELARTRRAKEK